ncbi:MAG: PAS domain S-box protein [Bacteroidota bacterium]
MGKLQPPEDVESRDKFLNSLAESYLVQDAILNSTELSVISVTKDGIINSVNPAAEKLLGYTAQELIGKKTPVIIHDPHEKQQRAKELSKELGFAISPGFDVFVAKAKHTKQADRRRWTYVRKDGSRFPVLLSVSGIFNEAGEAIGFLGIATDMTEQAREEQEKKKAEQQLAESEQKFRLLAENIPGVIYLCRNDVSYSMVYLNERVEELTGYKATEFLAGSVHFVQLYHPDDAPAVFEQVDKALALRKSFHLEYRIQHKNGECRWVEEVGVGVYRDGELALIEGFICDITERKKNELSLKKMADENNRIFNYSIHLQVIAGYDGFFKKVNPACAKILGWSASEMKQKPFVEFVHPDDRTSTQAAFGQLLKGEDVASFENRYLCRNGTYRWLLWSSSTDVERELIYATAIDITERKKTEENLVVSKINLESAAEELRDQNHQLNQFAHILSHNLRSPVANIGALIGLLNEQSTMADYREIFRNLKITATSLQGTLNDLVDTLDISKASRTERVLLNFAETLEQVRKDLIGELISSHADIEANFNLAPEIFYNKTYFESIILNLLSNALKYRSPARKLKIKCSTRPLGEKVMFTFSDNGLGIDLKKYGDQIFGLRKTFHPHPDAKGVGLFLTKTQINAMGGSIDVASEVDKGTTFTIIF